MRIDIPRLNTNVTVYPEISDYLELLNSIVHLDSEKVIGLKWEEEEKIRLQNMKWYLNLKNFRLQIGKMQEDWNTIYTPKTMGLFVDYILNHAELDENWNWNVIIQLWPDLAQCLSQNGKKWILTFTQEKEEIEKIIKEKLKEKWKNIKIEIKSVADNYPDVFNAIKKWKEWIIPNEEPKLENFELPLKSPKPIIEYLAYHFNKDTNLGKLFYSTKPAKYKEQDGENYIPWTSGADYYSVVEVWIRLYEVLNWIYIQWWIDRQRVYDKIIYLILFGEDKIGKENEQLNIEHYPSLWKLHNFLNKSWENDNVKMMQLYIDLNKVKSETKKAKDKIKEQLKKESMELAPGLIKQLSDQYEQLGKLYEKLCALEEENRMLQNSVEKSKSGLIKTRVLVALLSVLWLWLKNISNNGWWNITKIEESAELPSKKWCTKENLSPNTIKNTIESDLEDFTYTYSDGGVYTPLVPYWKTLEYKIGNTSYYCIEVIYRDKTLLLAKKWYTWCVFSLKDWRKVAEDMV